MYIDSHCHLNFEKFQDDYQQTIKRASDSGVSKIINVGSNFETSKRAVEIAREFPGQCFSAVGLHPIHVMNEGFGQKFMDLAKQKEVVAIGETGLDFFHLPSKNKGEFIKKQEEVFIKHLDLAGELKKPVILHCRDAYPELIKILKDYSKPIKKVLHCYDGNLEYLQAFLDLDCMISFTGNVTYGSNRDEAIKQIPADRMMIETDAPYLAPVPYRGKRNEPAYVVEVAKYIAKIKNIELDKIENILQKITKNFFKI